MDGQPSKETNPAKCLFWRDSVWKASRSRDRLCRYQLPRAVFVRLGPAGQAAFRRADEVHDHLAACQRAVAPVVRDATGRFVPLSRPGRKMANGDPEAGIVGKLLLLPYPQAVAAAVRADAIGRNQQTARPGTGMTSHYTPPLAQRRRAGTRRTTARAQAASRRGRRQRVLENRAPRLTGTGVKRRAGAISRLPVKHPNERHGEFNNAPARQTSRRLCAHGRAGHRDSARVRLDAASRRLFSSRRSRAWPRRSKMQKTISNSR